MPHSRSLAARAGRNSEALRDLKSLSTEPFVGLAASLGMLSAHKSSKTVDKEAVAMLKVPCRGLHSLGCARGVHNPTFGLTNNYSLSHTLTYTHSYSCPCRAKWTTQFGAAAQWTCFMLHCAYSVHIAIFGISALRAFTSHTHKATHTPPRARLLTYQLLALHSFLWHDGRHDKARDLANRILKEDKDSVEGLTARGWINMTCGRDSMAKKASKDFDDAIAIADSTGSFGPGLMAKLGKIWCEPMSYAEPLSSCIPLRVFKLSEDHLFGCKKKPAKAVLSTCACA